MKKKMEIIVTVVFLTMGLIACGTTTEEASEEFETELITLEETSDIGVENEREIEIEEKDIVVETEQEMIEESMEEETVYEGIDMESTLSGEDWTQTFDGIIKEPKAVVINDTTNKKMIIEEGEEVMLEEGDIFAIYLPDYDMWINNYEGEGVEKKAVRTYARYYHEMPISKEDITEKTTITIEITNFIGDKQLMELEYVFLPNENDVE